MPAVPIRFLQSPAAWRVLGVACDQVETVETRRSWVFLAGDRVLKLKKPVCERLIDFSTPERRSFSVGVPLTETLLLDFQDRLQKSGLFERATVSVDAEPRSIFAVRYCVAVSPSRCSHHPRHRAPRLPGWRSRPATLRWACGRQRR